jgi:hypothetical protein
VTDITAIKARLSDPREVARLLGLRVIERCSGGVRVQCPIHGSKGGSLGLRCVGGTLQATCFAGCFKQGGDILTLLEAIEGDFKRGLARAVELAGGAVGKPEQQFEEVERCDPGVYHALAERILIAGRLDGRAWVRPVEAYLQQRRLLELARVDGWAALPGLKWLLDIARDVCDQFNQYASPAGEPSGQGLRAALVGAKDTRGQGAGISPPELLILAGLAQWGRDGKLRAKWGHHRLVIPWRSPDGRISALQRRRIEEAETQKYVFPAWKPDWPYGSDRLCMGLDRKEIGYGMSEGSNEPRRQSIRDERGVVVGACCATESHGGARAGRKLQANGGHLRVDGTRGNPTIAICEGAVDTLALRALYPRLDVIGIPGIDGWRPEWAELIEGRGLRAALDRGKVKDGKIVPEDRAAARIALDCAGMAARREDVIEWLTRRFRHGKPLFCVLCGAEEPWLCGACGRRRAKGKDWGEDWATKAGSSVC